MAKKKVVKRAYTRRKAVSKIAAGVDESWSRPEAAVVERVFTHVVPEPIIDTPVDNVNPPQFMVVDTYNNSVMSGEDGDYEFDSIESAQRWVETAGDMDEPDNYLIVRIVSRGQKPEPRDRITWQPA